MKASDTGSARPLINVCLMQPPGYIHALALTEAAEYVAEKSRLAGYPARLSKNGLARHGLNIVFGAHIAPQDSGSYPANTVIFNTEQIPEKSAWINSDYKRCLESHFVWDYSDFNIRSLGHGNARRIDFYHVDALRRLPPQPEQPEYDLVFYGSMNDRRKSILEDLRRKGLKILTLFGVYGAERDQLLQKGRAVLNLHFYESQIFQQIRAFYPLSNGIPVISEDYPEASAPPLYRDVVFTPGGAPFTEFVRSLLASPGHFERESGARTERFLASRNNDDFAKILETTIQSVLDGASAMAEAGPLKPAKICIGSKPQGHEHLHVDDRPENDPDILVDLSAPLSLPVTCDSALWGPVALAESQCDEILAVNALSRISDLAQLMSNCLKLLREGGRMVIQVPYDLSAGAWQDPSHVRAFNENSWLPYTQWFWQLGWHEHRFECTETALNLTDFGKSLLERNLPQDEIFRTPRAIDAMKVTLTKRKTTAEEKTIARSHQNHLGHF